MRYSRQYVEKIVKLFPPENLSEFGKHNRNTRLPKFLISEIVKIYSHSDLTTVDLARLYGVSQSAMYNYIRKSGCVMKTQSELQRKYTLDETFFDKIDTEGKAYMLGFLYADGYNNEKRRTIQICLQERDKEILEKFKFLLKSNSPIHISEQKNKKYVSLAITSGKISDNLVKYGCMQAKTFKIKFPTFLEEDLLRHFIRGYVDGDGYIGYYGECNRFELSITSTKEFCEELANILVDKFGVHHAIRTRHPENNNNIRTLRITRKKDVINCINLFYKDATVYLERKYNKYLEILKLYGG